jgi:hypothetical protein
MLRMITRGDLASFCARVATTRIVLPMARAARYCHLITGEWCEPSSDSSSNVPIASALRTCPVARLWAPARESPEIDPIGRVGHVDQVGHDVRRFPDHQFRS